MLRIEHVYSPPPKLNEAEIVIPDNKNYFISVTSLLDTKESDELADDINCLHDLPNKIGQVVELATERDYQKHEAFFLNDEFEIYAFAALREGKLSDAQFGTLMYIHAALSNGAQIEDLRVVPLFSSCGAISTEAWMQISEQVKDLGIDLPLFFELMRHLPQSEQAYILVPGIEPANKSVIEAIRRGANFKLFSYVTLNGMKLRMLFSFGMIQSLVAARGVSLTHIKFVVKLSTVESLRLSMLNENAREFCIHTKRFPAPPEADGHFASSIDFMYHDLYHAYLCSCIPLNVRTFACRMAEKFNPMCCDLPAAPRFYELLVDMEFNTFRPDLGNGCKKEKYTFFRVVQMIIEVTSSASHPLADMLKAYAALWLVYHHTFEEVDEAYAALSKELKSTIGPDLFEAAKGLGNYYPRFMEISDLAQFKYEEIARVAWLLNENRLELQNLTKFVTFREIQRLSAEEQDRILPAYVFVGHLLERGVALQSIVNTDPETFLLMAKYSHYLIGWLKWDNDLSLITRYCRQFNNSIFYLNQWTSDGMHLKEMQHICSSRLEFVVKYIRILVELDIGPSVIRNADEQQWEALSLSVKKHSQ